MWFLLNTLHEIRNAKQEACLLESSAMLPTYRTEGMLSNDMM